MRYFFHLYNDIQTHDEEGTELPNLAAALQRATNAACDMAAESVRQGKLNLSHYIEITGADGSSVGKVTFSDAVVISH